MSLPSSSLWETQNPARPGLLPRLFSPDLNFAFSTTTMDSTFSPRSSSETNPNCSKMSSLKPSEISSWPLHLELSLTEPLQPLSKELTSLVTGNMVQLILETLQGGEKKPSSSSTLQLSWPMQHFGFVNRSFPGLKMESMT